MTRGHKRFVTRSRTTSAVTVALVGVVLGFTACGGAASAPTTTAATSASTTAPPTTAAITTTTAPAGPTTKQLAARYVALVAPYNADVNKLASEINSVNTDAELTTALAPMLAESQKIDNAILRMGLTGQAATDARSFVTADAQFVSLLSGATIASLNLDESALTSDQAAVSAADNALRADLGLPAASS